MVRGLPASVEHEEEPPAEAGSLACVPCWVLLACPGLLDSWLDEPAVL